MYTFYSITNYNITIITNKTKLAIAIVNTKSELTINLKSYFHSSSLFFCSNTNCNRTNHKYASVYLPCAASDSELAADWSDSNSKKYCKIMGM